MRTVARRQFAKAPVESGVLHQFSQSCAQGDRDRSRLGSVNSSPQPTNSSVVTPCHGRDHADRGESGP